MGERLTSIEAELKIYKEREKELETRVVKHFDRDRKRGQIHPGPEGRVMSFYLDDYRQFRPGITVPQWAQESETIPLTWDKMPATGIKVVFEQEQERRGTRASPWGLADEFDNMAFQMETLPLYRVRSLTSGKTVWMGRDKNDPVISHLVGAFERLEKDKWVPSSHPRKR
ncbi:hypothetical protein IID21_01315 [Patescibacteria group bacterium]|nr:hypothetical protein [Patescibacteria group bacterium]